MPDRPLGIPLTCKEHAALMFNLQFLAFQANIRVRTLLLAAKTRGPTSP